MPRMFLAAAVTVLLTAFVMPSARAQGPAYGQQYYGGPSYGTMPMVSQEQAIRAKSATAAPHEPAVTPPLNISAGPVAPAVGSMGQYPQLDASLYPAPVPTVPTHVGTTIITNEAFAPHEMLYPHTYRAIYPPFYHKVHGDFIWTPFGMRSHEKWKLEGTVVEVKYRSHHPWFPKFIPPHIH